MQFTLHQNALLRSATMRHSQHCNPSSDFHAKVEFVVGD